MTEVPKIVHHRLRAAELGRQAEQAHPEADVLTAFAEQALSQADREGVLGHLALCTDCRDLVSLALPASEFAATPAAAATGETESEATHEPVALKARRSWFAWADFSSSDLRLSNLRFSNLRWAALAAGVAVALFVMHAGLGNSGKTNQPGMAANRAATPAVQLAPAQVASEVPSQSGVATNTKAVAGKPALTDSVNAAPVRKPPTGLAQPLIARNSSAPLAAPDRLAQAPTANRFAQGSPTATSETVEVSNSTAEVTTLSDSNLMARLEPPSIEKAKPPLDEAAPSESAKKEATAVRSASPLQTNGMVTAQTVAPAPTLKQGTLWTIKAGVLQRSLDGGQNWLPVLQGQHIWLCYATHDQEVWAGGQAGALQHSADGGASWSPMATSTYGHSLGADIIRIEVMDSSSIMLTTSDHQTWTTTDGGKIWVVK